MLKKIALVNGRIHTPAGVRESLLIEGGRISETSLPPKAHPDTEVVDLKGRSVFPGFADSHMHLMAWLESRELLDLKPCRSIDDLKAALAAHIEAHPEGKWRRGRGWDHTTMGRMPNRHDLDEASPDVPTALTRICGHVVVVNTAALKLPFNYSGTTRLR